LKVSAKNTTGRASGLETRVGSRHRSPRQRGRLRRALNPAYRSDHCRRRGALLRMLASLGHLAASGA
jgi:hypothetical protein